MWVVSGLSRVVSGGGSAALGGRWRGGGEVNLSVIGHLGETLSELGTLRKGTGGFTGSAAIPPTLSSSLIY